MKCVAQLPDGTRRWLLNIPDWDFDWQDDYRYADPVFLPAGTTVSMEFLYDNSAGNSRNPHNPPRRVVEGPQSTDEMGSVSLQFLPRSPAAALQLRELFWRRGIQRVPDNYYAHFAAGVQALLLGNLPQARTDYENCLRLNPRFLKAHFNLAHVYFEQQEFDLALRQYERVLEISPGNAVAHFNLGRILERKQDLTQAATHYQQAIEADPTMSGAHNGLGVVFARRGDFGKAAELFAQAVEIDPDYGLAHLNLANAYLMQKDFARAVTHYNEALRIDPQDADARRNLERARAALGKE
jgi:tetratricopeptide (TPR) repeat protein